MMLTTFDKALLNTIQIDLPLTSRPFSIIAERLGVEESMVIERLRQLKAEGLIRRIGPFFNSNRLGYVSTLVAVQVQQDCMEQVAEAINVYPGVTHNYEREGSFNLWFALLAANTAEQNKVLAEVRNIAGVEKLLSLPATKKFKVSVQFAL
jgi:DNA-binding Lrp family transcriptional regulator